MLTVLALLAQDYVLREPRTSVVTAYGPFRLEREDCIEHPDVGVLHYAHCSAKVRLIWSSADRRVSARYEDDGTWLTRVYQYTYHVNAPQACYVGLSLTAYGARVPNPAAWRASASAFSETLARCSVFRPAEVAAYQTEFAAAAPHFQQAAGALRSLATAMFNNLRRCVEQRTSPPYGGPDATVTCAREEGPAS